MMQAGSAAPVVFICRDAAVDPVFEEIARELALRGIATRRGPLQKPGRIGEFPAQTCPALFGDVDVAMFTSRWRCTRELLQFAPRLRGVVNPTIGLETVDIEACTDRGIAVGHGAIPENFESMAEASVMLMLNLMYNLRASEEVLQGKRPKPLPGAPTALARMVKGSTVGLIGFGRIAKAVARRLAPFEARLLACSPSLNPGCSHDGVQAVNLDTLLRESDLVGVFVAITDSSRHIIDSRALSLMKPSAYLVNVSRGEAIDQPALVRALTAKEIAGAALDTFEVEPLPLDSPLRPLDNVILTQHMVGHTREALAALVPAAVENIVRILKGQPPLHWKNPQLQPAWLGKPVAHFQLA